ncbi:MAG: macro domain-containing protein [Acidobacteriota bacterium]
MESGVLAEHHEADFVLQSVLGDMTAERVDAIVNAANNHLAHGGGLAGVIVARGGAAIQEESDGLAPVDTGGAAVTGAGTLPSRWVIHAVGPIWGQGNEHDLLESAVVASLERAADLGVASISFPAISTGIFGFPKKEGTSIIVETVRAWLTDHPESTLRLVRFTAIDEPTADYFTAAVRALATFMPES